MVNTAVWNVRGLNNPSKCREVGHFILSNKISLIALLETRISEPNVNQVVKSIRKQWNFCSNHSVSLSGRIIVMWDPAYLVFAPIFVNEQALHGEVTLPNQQKIYVSFVYGLCDSRDRKLLWDDISFCARSFKKSPWTLLGDFNVSRFSHEHSKSYRVTKAMKDFNNTITSAELEDLKSTGLNFTWSNMRSGTASISKKLDRVMGNCLWFQCFGNAYAHTHNARLSDHSPISIHLMQQGHFGRPFKFLNFWADHPDFLDIVRQEWVKSYEGSLLSNIPQKLKNLKGPLKRLSTRPDFATEDLRQKLSKVQMDMDERPEDVELKSQNSRLRKELAVSARKEEAFFKQKSRVHWLKEGDSSTAFFHRAVKMRQSKITLLRSIMNQVLG
ncbi:Exo_endo_phos domain-containing protein [Cephalotus follicularis]|uniref:Exo_endo_phos domain-containing protein n=1 Tax=Cephalotus follicularis TaxID=3775 RepID=A0A1Q3CIZ6_CEPFO|nr:Exo_endo_phos domain-containing protein [Cephalotus follicularis]